MWKFILEFFFKQKKKYDANNVVKLHVCLSQARQDLTNTILKCNELHNELTAWAPTHNCACHGCEIGRSINSTISNYLEWQNNQRICPECEVGALDELGQCHTCAWIR